MIKKERRKSSDRKITLFLWFALVALILLGGILINIKWKIIEKIKQKDLPPQEVEVRDECVLILGKLIHQLENEDGCKIKCTARCEIEEKEIYNSSFTQSETDCHVCKCLCK